MSWSKLWEIVKDREVGHLAGHRVTKSQTLLRDNSTTTQYEGSVFREKLGRKWRKVKEVVDKQDAISGKVLPSQATSGWSQENTTR